MVKIRIIDAVVELRFSGPEIRSHEEPPAVKVLDKASSDNSCSESLKRYFSSKSQENTFFFGDEFQGD